jgi:uncharacterized membrane protein
MLQDLMKTGSFAVLHFSIGFGVAYLISGSLPVALGVALVEPAVNTVVFFLHERVWKRVSLDANVSRKQPRIDDHHSFSNLRAMALHG